MGELPKKGLTKKQADFVAAYLLHGKGTMAARAVGYQGGRADRAGQKLLQQKEVVKAIQDAQKEMINRGVYSLQQAMKEAQDTIDFARETGNANAMAKAIELRSKLNGLLVEKHQHQVASFSLNIGGIDDDVKPEIDVTTLTGSKDDEDLFS